MSPTPAISKDFTIAIVGGGMVGLACAIPLSRAGLNVTIFESAKQFGEVGAGVGLARNGLLALEGLGLLDAIQSIPGLSKGLEGFLYISGAGDHEPMFQYRTKPDELMIPLYRPAYISAVLPLLDPSIVRCGKRCVLVTKNSAAASGRTTLHFEDGTTFTADLVIGADGIKSVTRNYVTGEETPHLCYTGHSVYRSMVRMDDLRNAGLKTDITGKFLSWMYRDKHIISFTVANDTILNVAAFARNEAATPHGMTGPWVESVSRQEVLDQYEGWGEDVQLIIEHMEAPSKWYIHSVSPTLDSFAKDNVVLVGDSAHAMLPHLGAGVNQGFEDAYALYRLLTHPKTNRSNLKHILQIYSNFRAPRANMVLKQTALMGYIYDEHASHGLDDQKFMDNTLGIWTPVWRYDIDKEVDALLVETGLGLPVEVETKNIMETGQVRSLL